MDFMIRHHFPLDAWLAVEKTNKSPDSRIAIKKVTIVPDGCLLTFDYETTQPWNAAFDCGLVVTGIGDFYVGKKPTMYQTIIVDKDKKAHVFIEWRVRVACAVYRAISKTLYLCV